MTFDEESVSIEYHRRGLRNAFAFGIFLGALLGGMIVVSVGLLSK